jgi:hypothetical protein
VCVCVIVRCVAQIRFNLDKPGEQFIISYVATDDDDDDAAAVGDAKRRNVNTHISHVAVNSDNGCAVTAVCAMLIDSCSKLSVLSFEFVQRNYEGMCCVSSIKLTVFADLHAVINANSSKLRRPAPLERGVRVYLLRLTHTSRRRAIGVWRQRAGERRGRRRRIRCQCRRCRRRRTDNIRCVLVRSHERVDVSVCRHDHGAQRWWWVQRSARCR